MATTNNPTGCDDFSVFLVINQIKNNDFSEFEENFENISQWLLKRLLTRFSGSLDLYTLESCVQETMFRLLTKAWSFRGDSEPSAKSWLLTIARHIALDEISRNSRETGISEIVERKTVLSFGNPKDCEDDCQAVDWKKFKEILTRRESEVLDLKSQGYKNSEIAELLQLSRSRVTQIVDGIEDKLKCYAKRTQ